MPSHNISDFHNDTKYDVDISDLHDEPIVQVRFHDGGSDRGVLRFTVDAFQNFCNAVQQKLAENKNGKKA